MIRELPRRGKEAQSHINPLSTLSAGYGAIVDRASTGRRPACTDVPQAPYLFRQLVDPFNIFGLAFPEHENLPACRRQFGCVQRVPRLIANPLGFPISDVALNAPLADCTMGATVPEASMNEHHRLSSGEHEVRRAWQRLAMKPVAQSQPMQMPSYRNLGFGVLAANARHNLAAALRSDCVHCNSLTSRPIEALQAVGQEGTAAAAPGGWEAVQTFRRLRAHAGRLRCVPSTVLTAGGGA